ncbi:MAG TPA: M48 family peptidase, partial [Burkholderiales bacterium]|nr:M48 family peptidase [Burkholderiales bacterium]
MNRSLAFFAAALLAVLAAGCQTVETTQPGVVGVSRQQRMAVSSEEVNASAEKQYAQMMAQAKQKNAL